MSRRALSYQGAAQERIFVSDWQGGVSYSDNGANWTNRVNSGSYGYLRLATA